VKLAPPKTELGWLSQITNGSLFHGNAGSRSFCGDACLYGSLTKVANQTTIPLHIFQTAFQRTGNITVAFQAFLTTVLMTAHNAYSGNFDAISPARITYVVEVERPVGKAFAIMVISVLILLYLILVVGISVVFGRGKGEDLVLGGAWAAVSQMRGGETNKWLAVSSRVRDSEVTRRIEAAREADVLVGLKLKEGSDQLSLRRVVSSRG